MPPFLYAVPWPYEPCTECGHAADVVLTMSHEASNLPVCKECWATTLLDMGMTDVVSIVVPWQGQAFAC